MIVAWYHIFDIIIVYQSLVYNLIYPKCTFVYIKLDRYLHFSNYYLLLECTTWVWLRLLFKSLESSRRYLQF